MPFDEWDAKCGEVAELINHRGSGMLRLCRSRRCRACCDFPEALESRSRQSGARRRTSRSHTQIAPVARVPAEDGAVLLAALDERPDYFSTIDSLFHPNQLAKRTPDHPRCGSLIAG